MSKFWKKYQIYILSAGSVAFFMMVLWVARGILTGKNSLIIIDGLHQYMPYFADYYDKLKSGDTLFYSFKEGLGTNFLSLWAYYLSSPMNLLILLFPREKLNTAVSLVVTLKVVGSAFTFSYLLSKRKGGADRSLYIVPLSVAYAMSFYVIGYYWNVMWMDCIMIFPLIILGYEYLAERGDIRLYTITLFYALFTNYYIGFIICIFLVLWALFYPYKTWKETFRSAGLFSVSSLLAGGLAAVLLVPAYMGIMQTASAKRVLPGWDQYGSYFDILQQLFAKMEPINNQVDDGGVNLYCGIFAILLTFVFLISKEFDLAEKARYIFLLVLFTISFNTEILNYIWHGFHNQYGIPNRFSFLFIFILLWMAASVLARVRDLNRVVIFIAGGCGLVLLGLCWFMTDKRADLATYLITLGLMIAYVVILFFVCGKPKKETPKTTFTVPQWVLFGFMLFELVVSCSFGWGSNGVISYQTYFGSTEDVAELRRNLAVEDKGFYRAEIANSKMLDEVTWHGLNAVTMFGSTAQGEVVTAMGKIGFYTGANEYLYCGATPFTAALTSTKYLIFRDGDFNNTDFEYYNTIGDIYVYKNPQWLPIGICMDDAATAYQGRSTYFTVQNEFASRAIGEEVTLFDQYGYTWDAYGEGCNVTVSENQIRYTVTGGTKPTVTAEMELDRDMDYYVDISGGNVRQIHIMVDGEEIAYDRYQTQAFRIGRLNKGQKVGMRFEFNDNGTTEGTITLHSADFKEEAWNHVYEKLSENTFDPEICTSGHIEGKVTAKEGQVLFLSVPADDGWKVKVDGVPTETEKVLDAFIAIPLTEGEHSIEMHYESPGIRTGILLSLGSLICTMGFFFLTEMLRKRRMQREAAKKEEASAAVEETLQEETSRSSSGKV